MEFDQETDDGRRNRKIAFSVLGLVVAGVLVGLLVGGLGLAAMRTADLGNTSSEPDEEPSAERTTQTQQPDDEPSDEPTTEETTRKPRARPGSLVATPTSVSTDQQIDLTGRFPAANVTLQVQRREGGVWTDFAGVTATTQADGTFSTYVITGQSGVNLFRLHDPASGRSTPRVAVQVG